MNYLDKLNKLCVGDFFNVTLKNGTTYEGVITGRSGNNVFYVDTITNAKGSYIHCFKALYINDSLVRSPYEEWTINSNLTELKQVFSSVKLFNLIGTPLRSIGRTVKEVEDSTSQEIALLRAENLALKERIQILEVNQKPPKLKEKIKNWLVKKLTN